MFINNESGRLRAKKIVCEELRFIKSEAHMNSCKQSKVNKNKATC